MNTKLSFYLLCVLAMLCAMSCQKIQQNPNEDKCSYATDGSIVKKWASVSIQIDEFNSAGVKERTSFDHPAGFIQFNSTNKYNAVSDGLSAQGSWSFDANCNLTLDAGGALGVVLEVVKLTTDSLVVRKKVGTSVLTQRYKAYACDYQPYLTKKWANVFTQIDSYSPNGTTIASSAVIKPVGFFQLTADGAYRVLSDGVPLNGKWTANSSYCQITLDTLAPAQRTFEIVKATADSLVIRRKAGNLVYTQHYKAVTCPTLAQLQKKWDNSYIQTSFISNGSVGGSYFDYPYGYFQLNADLSYAVESNGDSRSGSWLLTDQASGCQLTLDANNALKRSFDILKLTSDSLTIYRQDMPNGVSYTQVYKKH